MCLGFGSRLTCCNYLLQQNNCDRAEGGGEETYSTRTRTYTFALSAHVRQVSLLLSPSINTMKELFNPVCLLDSGASQLPRSHSRGVRVDEEDSDSEEFSPTPSLAEVSSDDLSWLDDKDSGEDESFSERKVKCTQALSPHAPTGTTVRRNEASNPRVSHHVIFTSLLSTFMYANTNMF